MFDESVDADVLQADGIEHAADRFADPWGRVAGFRVERQAFGDNRTQPVQVQVGGVLFTVTEGP